MCLNVCIDATFDVNISTYSFTCCNETTKMLKRDKTGSCSQLCRTCVAVCVCVCSWAKSQTNRKSKQPRKCDASTSQVFTWKLYLWNVKLSCVVSNVHKRVKQQLNGSRKKETTNFNSWLILLLRMEKHHRCWYEMPVIVFCLLCLAHFSHPHLIESETTKRCLSTRDIQL